jgi:hypothetical protein
LESALTAFADALTSGGLDSPIANASSAIDPNTIEASATRAWRETRELPQAMVDPPRENSPRPRRPISRAPKRRDARGDPLPDMFKFGRSKAAIEYHHARLIAR